MQYSFEIYHFIVFQKITYLTNIANKMIKILVSLVVILQSDMVVECSHSSQVPKIALSIVFICGGLMFGGFLKLVSRKIQISYNALLLGSGMMLGFYHDYLWKSIGNSVMLISEMSPQSLLAIFLPPLIFQSAYKVEWHIFKTQFFQALIMGVPCVIVNSLFIMLGFKLILHENAYTWGEAFMLGSILSCTDIFSYIAKLRQDSVPNRIIAIIQSQSLFNYCTCVIIFQVMNEITINQTYTYYQLSILLVQQIVGGILFGSLFAFLAVYWIKRIAYDGVLVGSIMAIFCYFIYIITEFTMIPISGITSLVSFGIFMASFGRPQLTQSAREYSDGFWKYLVYAAQTTIFLVAGTMVGRNVMAIEDLIQKQDYLYFIIVYSYILAARFISMGIFIKWLRLTGYGMNWKQILIITFAGLKGAIGISFAMVIFHDNSYSTYMRNLIFFHVTLNSIFTTSINPFITKILVKLLKISTLTKVQYKFFKEFLVDFKEIILEKKEQLKDQKFLDLVDWQGIDNKVGIFQYTELQIAIQKIITTFKDQNQSNFQKRQLFKLEQLLNQFKKQNSQRLASEAYQIQTINFNTLVEIRKRFIKTLIQKYWEYHLNNNTSPPAFKLLLQSAYYDLDTEIQELQSWQWIKEHISQPYIKFLSQLRKYPILRTFGRDYLFNYLSYCYDAVSSYIQAQQEVRNQFKLIMPNVDPKFLDIILNQCFENQKQAENFLKNYLKPSFPEIQRQVRTKKASFNLLLSFKNTIDRFYQTGQVQSNEYQILTSMINDKALDLQLEASTWQTIHLTTILHQDELFGLLPQKILLMLQENLSEAQTFDSNQIIYTRSDTAKYFYFVKRGSCEIEFINNSSAYKQHLVVGDCFGFETLVYHSYKSTVTASAMVSVLKIKRICIEKVIDTFPQFEQKFWKRYLFCFYKMFMDVRDLTSSLTLLEPEGFDQIFIDFKLTKLDPGKHQFQYDAIFLRGQAEEENQLSQKSKLSPMEFLSCVPHPPKVVVTSRSSFLTGQFDYDRFLERSNSRGRFMSKKQRQPNQPLIILKRIATLV